MSISAPDPTVDPALHSFVSVPSDSHFPIQNLPYGVFRRPGQEKPQVGVRIGDFVLDLKALEHAGFFRDVFGDAHVFCKWGLNKFLAAGRDKWRAVRTKVSTLLRHDNPALRDDAARRATVLVPVEQVEMLLPAEIGDYTDFYSSREHATNVGTMFRGKDNALMPNWLWLPVGYHGRASSLVVSGTPIRRPTGQTCADESQPPKFGPTRSLDFELETGFLVGPGNALGSPIALRDAWDHIFGMLLVNDCSARDIQRWEYQPLGPFLAKNFATTVSPWVVPMDALAPFRCPAPEQDPRPLGYLDRSAGGPAGDAFDIRLEVALRTAASESPHVICRSNFRHLYWTMPQQLAHHTITGCNLRPGDLLASGTISGPTPDSYGSMLELAWRGERPIRLPTGEERRFLEDGDEVIMTGLCENAGYRIGFGECRGKVLPAL